MKEEIEEKEKEIGPEEEKMDSFCKLIIGKPPRCLKIPKPFFRESMRDGVVVAAGGEEKLLGVLNTEEGDHYLKWSAFLSGGHLACGSLVAVKHVFSNSIRITVYCSAGNTKDVRGWSKASAATLSDCSFDSFGNEAPEPASLGGSSSKVDSEFQPFTTKSTSSNSTAFRDVADVRRKLHFARESNRYITPGTAGAMSKAKAFQKQSLSNPSMLMVLTNRAVNLRCHVPFIVKFVDEYCRWSDREIILQDRQDNKYSAFWNSGRNPGIAWGLDVFLKAHKLRTGDVCVFEVVRDGFIVHTFFSKNYRSEFDNPRRFEEFDGPRKFERDFDGLRWPPKEFDGLRKPRDYSDALKKLQRNDETVKRKRDLVDPAASSFEREKKSREDEIVFSTTGSDGMQVQILYKKDKTGLLCPHLTALVPLSEEQFNKLKGPFASAEDMLKMFIETTTTAATAAAAAAGDDIA